MFTEIPSRKIRSFLSATNVEMYHEGEGGGSTAFLIFEFMEVGVSPSHKFATTHNSNDTIEKIFSLHSS